MSTRRAVPASALVLAIWLLPSCTAAPPPRPLPAVAPAVIEPIAGDWPRRDVLALALRAYHCGQREGQFARPYLTVIDYSLPSSERRLWVIDVSARRVLHHELVAHGEGSGGVTPVSFSNNVGSHQSSLGLFRTDEPYVGRFGYSLRLSGLEPGFNDKARERAIVVHGMAEVSQAAAAKWGAVGRSWGCPALPEEVSTGVIDTIANGSAIFAYYPDTTWLQESYYLNCSVQLADAAAFD